MKISLDTDEEALAFAVDSANATAKDAHEKEQVQKSEKDRQPFTPIDPQDYAQARWNETLASYKAQKLAKLRADKEAVIAFALNLPKEDADKLAAFLGTLGAPAPPGSSH